MKVPPERPNVFVLAFALVSASALIVPEDLRNDFEYDWRQRLLHRWQFLSHNGLWDFREAVKLFFSAMAVMPDAIQHFGAQESVRTRVSRFVQSPLTCLGGLAAILLAIAICSGGLPATRSLFFQPIDSRLVYIWSHNPRSGGDRPLPADAVEAWKTHSQLISGAAAFRAIHHDVQVEGGTSQRRLVVSTEPDFFHVEGTKPLTGNVDGDGTSSYVLLSYSAWMQLFHASPQVLGKTIRVSGQSYPIRGVLPADFEPLSRQLAIYRVQPHYLEQDAYVVVRTKPGVSQKELNSEFLEIAEDVTYYFLNGQLRFGYAESAAWAPVRSFAVGAFASALMLFMFFRLKWRTFWPAANHGKEWLRQSAFFAVKTALALACVFTACLEWSRSTSAFLFGNFDPASGPFLLWLYILGTMGVFFWSAFDQKARCRQCLQLLAFPVRMGSPGNLLLDWSGIELCCTEGHGVLHVPHLTPSWADESDHWIALDDSWQAVFGRDKHTS